MAGKPEVKPPNRLGKEQIADIADKTVTSAVSQTLPIPQPGGDTPKAAQKAKPKKGKLQLIIPLVVLWKLRIAAAQEGTTVGKLLLKWITEPLKRYDYPTMPEWLKKHAKSEDKLNAAA